MKQAGKAGARFAVILGDEELAKGEAMLRNMAGSEQSPLPIAADADAWARELAVFSKK